MRRICQECRILIGEKEPFQDSSETTGICAVCLPAVEKSIDDFLENRNKEGAKMEQTEKYTAGATDRFGHPIGIDLTLTIPEDVRMNLTKEFLAQINEMRDGVVSDIYRRFSRVEDFLLNLHNRDMKIKEEQVQKEDNSNG